MAGGRWPISALFAVTVWGASFVASKIALEGFTPTGLVALRLAMGALVLWFALALRGGPLLPEKRDRARTVLLGLILATHIGTQTYGLSFTLATHAAWIVCFGSVVIAIGAQFFLNQRLRAIGWAGVLVAIAGVLGVTRSAPPELSEAGFGDLLQVLGCFTWAAYTLLGSRPVASSGALRVTTLAASVAVLPLLVLSLANGFTRDPGARELSALLYLGLLSSAAAFLAWYHAQRVHGSQVTAATLYVEPFVTVIVAAFFGEPLSLVSIAGGLVVLAGVWLVHRGAAPSPVGSSPPPVLEEEARLEPGGPRQAS